MKKIFVVDDEVDFCKFIKNTLEQYGYNVSTCSESKDALSAIVAFKPDLILLDIHMPGISGDHIADHLRNYDETKKTPVIFVSVLVKEEEAELRNNIFGQHYVLSKPVKIPELLKTIKLLLGQ